MKSIFSNLVKVSLTRPKFVQGIINLFTDGMKYLIAVSLVVAVFMGGFFLVKWYTADDNEKPAAMKKVKHVVIGAVAVIAFEGLLMWVLSYF